MGSAIVKAFPSVPVNPYCRRPPISRCCRRLLPSSCPRFPSQKGTPCGQGLIPGPHLSGRLSTNQESPAPPPAPEESSARPRLSLRPAPSSQAVTSLVPFRAAPLTRPKPHVPPPAPQADPGPPGQELPPRSLPGPLRRVRAGYGNPRPAGQPASSQGLPQRELYCRPRPSRARLGRAAAFRPHLIELPLGCLPQRRVHCAPQGLDDGVGVHGRGSGQAGLGEAGESRGSSSSSAARCAHGPAAPQRQPAARKEERRAKAPDRATRRRHWEAARLPLCYCRRREASRDL